MIIRQATRNDLPEIMDIYANARSFMAMSGNGDQWGTVYPSVDLIERDIDTKMYVAEENSSIACVFYYAFEHDPTYDEIFDGNWQNPEPYGVVHRIASARRVKGAARFCLDWAFNQCGNLKIDTHRNNIPMQNLLKSLGFTYCGIIHLESGDERLAFQKTTEAEQ